MSHNVIDAAESRAALGFDLGWLSPRSRAFIAAVLVLVVAVAVALLPPLVALWLVFGSGVVALVLMRPMVGLYLLPFAVGFGSLISITVRGVHVGPTDLLVATLVLAWLARHVLRVPAISDMTTGTASSNPLRRAQPRRLSFAQITRRLSALRTAWAGEWPRVITLATLGAYLAVVTVSLVVATDRFETFKEMLKWGEVLAVVAVSLWLLSDVTRVRALAWSIIAAGLVEAAFALYEWATFGAEAATGRVFGTFDQPNPLAGFLNFALVLALALILFSDDARERWMASGGGVLLAVADLLARSRGGAVGIGAAIVLLVVVGWRRGRLFGWAIAVALPLLAIAWIVRLVPLSIQQRLLAEVRLDDYALCNNVNSANFSINQRLAQWAAGIRMFLAHPVLGVGAGNYDAAYTRYATSCWPDGLGHAHDYYINTAAETGILGFVAFLALTGATFALGVWATRHRGASEPSRLSAVAQNGVAILSGGGTAISRWREAPIGRALALGFFAAVVAVAALNLTDDLFVHAMELEFGLCLAALLQLGTLRRKTGG
jgi:O-antigen ligase